VFVPKETRRSVMGRTALTRSAKGADARPETVRDTAAPFRGAPDAATVLGGFLKRYVVTAAGGFGFLLVVNSALPAQKNEKASAGFIRNIPKMWDDAAMPTLEIPLANPIGSPKHVAADYYYKIPVRPIYNTYPVYAPGREPSGYIDWLMRQDPVIIWDDAGHRPTLQTEADWIKAGESVFDSDTFIVGESGGIFTLPAVKDSAWYEETGMPVARNGAVPFLHYVIRERGKPELGSFSCAMCHTRFMPDGTVLKGAQGSLPLDRAMPSLMPFISGPIHSLRGACSSNSLTRRG
jgi:hypothetical protein